MTKTPNKLKNFTGLFQLLCDAAMDLDPQPIADHIPEDEIECSHLLALAETAVTRECSATAEQLSRLGSKSVENIMIDHHQKVSNYLYIRSLILACESLDSDEEFDLQIF